MTLIACILLAVASSFSAYILRCCTPNGSLSKYLYIFHIELVESVEYLVTCKCQLKVYFVYRTSKLLGLPFVKH